MMHRISKKRLNRSSSHRSAMYSNMMVSLIKHEQCQTTLAKAKIVRVHVERLITKAKTSTNALSSRRYLLSILKDYTAVKKLIDILSVRYEKRPGGYTRVIKIGNRYGDCSDMAYLEFVDRDVTAKGVW